MLALASAALISPDHTVLAEEGEGADEVQRARQERIAMVHDASCVVVADDTVQCWGAQAGLGGAGGGTPEPYLSALGGPPVGDVESIAGGFQLTCVLLRTGELLCAGNNNLGQLGIGSTAQAGNGIYPVTVLDEAADGPLAGVTDMSVGRNHVCAVLGDTTLRCWGNNGQGKLGNPAAAGGDTDAFSAQPSPIAVVEASGAELTGVSTVAAAQLHTCALLDGDGSVQCWGDTGVGRLGNGSGSGFQQAPQPVALPAGIQARALAAGELGNHSCVVTADTEVYCWGENAFGQVGNGTRVNALIPQRVINEDGSPLVGALAVSAGTSHSCALLEGGAVRCWGRNLRGQIGVGSLDTSLFERAQVVVAPDGSGDPLTGARSMSVGRAHSCAILGDWSMVCWGWDLNGQVGNGTEPVGSMWPTPVYVDLSEPLDRAPSADPQTVEVPVGSAQTITLSGSDPDGDPLSFAVTTPPTGGTLSAISPATCSGFVCTATADYTPNGGTGGDFFEFTVDDGFETSDPALVTLTVVGPRAPTANDDSLSTPEDTSAAIDVAENDTDPDMNLDPSSVVVTSGPSKGTLTSNGDGTFIYTPFDDANGSDSFSYEICDTGGLCDTATVSITIDPVPDDPEAVNDEAPQVEEDGTVDVAVLDNDSDPDGDDVTVTSVSDPPNGTATINADQTVTYEPDPDFCGDDSFTYTIDDGTGRTATAVVSVEVGCVDDQPDVTVGGPYAGTEGAAIPIVSTISDPDSVPSVSWAYAAGPDVDPGATCALTDEQSAAPTLTCDDDGTFAITVTVDDGFNPLVSASTDVTVSNAAPMVDAGSDQEVDPDTPVTITATFTDDGSNDEHTATIDWGAGPQPVALGPSNTVTATFPGYANGTVATVTVEVCDDDGACDTDALVVTTDVCDIRGDDGPNTLIATEPGQVLCGFGGNDLLIGTFGNETLLGGDGDDTLRGGGGNDVLDGGPGARDRASWAFSPAPIVASLATGVATGEGTDTLIGIEDLFGSPFGDTLTGNGLVNHIFGQSGNDIIAGLGGDDLLFGGNGGDSISGGTGSDLLLGGDDASRDNLRGDSGNDDIFGGPGNDILSGGDGADIVNGGPGADIISGGGGGDILFGSDGEDNVRGGSGADNISGGADADRLFGQAGNDIINGNSGSDTINGGPGNDVLHGGTGANRLNGGPGDDTCSAGPPGETQRSCNP